MAPKTSEPGIFELTIVRYPYKVYYEIEGDEVRIHSRQPTPALGARARPDRLKHPQYVARPPEMSNTAPVVNAHSGEAQNATRSAISSTLTNRPRGIFASM